MRPKLFHRRCHMLTKNALFFGFIAGFCSVPGIAFGGEWAANFGTTMSAKYNDNPSLATAEEDKKGRTDISLNRHIDGTYDDERYSMNIAGNVGLTASKEEIAKKTLAVDQARYILSGGGNYDFETSVISAAFGLGFDTLQNTEFTDTGQLTSEGTSDITKTNANLGLNYSHSLDDYWGVNISNSNSLVTYSGGDFVGNKANSGGIGLSYSLSEYLSLSSNAQYSRSVPDSNTLSPSTTYNANFGGAYQLSDVDSLNGSLGVVKTGGTLGYSAALSYSQQVLEYLGANASLNRNHTAGEFGYINQSTSLSGGLSYQYSDSTNMGLSAGWRTSSQVGATGNNSTSGSGNITGNLSYQYSEMTNMGLSASWRTSSLAGATTTQILLSPSVRWTLNENWGANFSMENRRHTPPSGDTATSSSMILRLSYKIPIEIPRSIFSPGSIISSGSIDTPRSKDTPGSTDSPRSMDTPGSTDSPDQ